MSSVSIIVPIYNGEAELCRAVDSILNQTHTDMEIILVDDGSSDSSPALCDQYARQDSRVVVIHQPNAGVSAARNQGIVRAKGDYIGFVDADDWIEPDMYARLLSQGEATGSDVVMCDATTVFDNGTTQPDTIKQLSGNAILKKTDFQPSLLLEMAGSAWRCIYSKRIYGDKRLNPNGLQFPLDVKFSEDRIFNLYAFGYANQVCYLKESFYHRFMNGKSAVHRFHDDYFEAYKKAADATKQAIRDVWHNDPTLQKAYLGQFIGGAMGAICNYHYKTSTLSAKERKEKVRKLCDDRQLRAAIETYGASGKSKWVLDRRYGLLIAYARLANWKHGR